MFIEACSRGLLRLRPRRCDAFGQLSESLWIVQLSIEDGLVDQERGASGVFLSRSVYVSGVEPSSHTARIN